MRKIYSFKAQYRQAPVRAATPPPPVYEPLSPVLAPVEPFTTLPAGSHPKATATATHSGGPVNGSENVSSAPRQIGRAQLHLSSPAVTYEPHLSSAPLPQTLPQFSLALGSPIEALAEAAITSQHTRQSLAAHPRRASHASTKSPTATFPESTSEAARRQAYISDTSYTHGERPAKRARSELYASPLYTQTHSRPATSHIPGWSYNVEQMMDNGTRMYQDNRIPSYHQGGNGDDRISDAQLLLDFFNTSVHTAQTPPSTAKRWSMSQAERPRHYLQQMHGSPSHHIVAMPPIAYHYHHASAANTMQPASEPAFLSSGTLDAATAVQTHTPPEELSQPRPDTMKPDLVPAEDTKPRKHQGWPKGKPRGPRGASSNNRRKRPTPKPKRASSSSATVSADRLQSPFSLPVASSATNASSASFQSQHIQSSSHRRSAQNRRHSFSHPALPPPENLLLPLRARSVPLESFSASIEANPKLINTTKKAAPEQPELICAACKSSESETKVGDGEQWIGCDGCKEWYHYACAGFNSEREVREVNKFYCEPCKPKFGETTSRSADTHWVLTSNLVQRCGNPSEPTQLLTMPA